MRALLLAALILLPGVLAAAPEPRVDLIVTLREPGASLPPGALAIAAFPGFVLQGATEADALRLAGDPRVERIDRAAPLAFSFTQAALPTHAFTDLLRVDPDGPDGRGITVAVVDSGIDAAHPDLAGRVKQNMRLLDGRFVPGAGDTDGHGTHVAGIVGASGISSHGRWVGVAPAVELVGVDISGRFTTASAVLAYDWLLANHEALGIRVVVNAWGRIGEGERYDGRDPVIRAIDRLVADGVVVLFSASNHGPGPGTLSLEAMDPRVITVGATDAAGIPMPYSSRGPVAASPSWTKPDVMAPGDAVVGPRSTQTMARDIDPDAFHVTYSGTSQAVPHVAGIVALMLQEDPSMSPAAVAQALRESAIDLGEAGPDDVTGFGLVDAHDALRIARGHAPDRNNILITGGADRYQDASDVGATPRRSVFDILGRPDLVWETPFPVKPGAERLRVEASATGAQGLDLELVKDGRVLRSTEVERPDAGLWTLRLRGAFPLAANARISIETDLPANPARALQFDGRSTGPPPALGTEMPLTLPRGLAGPLLVAGLAVALLGVALWPRKGEN